MSLSQTELFSTEATFFERWKSNIVYMVRDEPEFTDLTCKAIILFGVAIFMATPLLFGVPALYAVVPAILAGLGLLIMLFILALSLIMTYRNMDYRDFLDAPKPQVDEGAQSSDENSAADQSWFMFQIIDTIKHWIPGNSSSETGYEISLGS